ncbi:MAG: hypothetical protein AAF623_21620, partial [Planctomycetota bacterium]
DYSLYTHNMILNVMLSGGVIAGLMAIAMVIGRIKDLLFHPSQIADSIAVFIIINGLTENVMFSILCGMPTLVWTFTLFQRQLEWVDQPDISDRLVISYDFSMERGRG